METEARPGVMPAAGMQFQMAIGPAAGKEEGSTAKRQDIVVSYAKLIACNYANIFDRSIDPNCFLFNYFGRDKAPIALSLLIYFRKITF
jgi:hypothetical protein